MSIEVTPIGGYGSATPFAIASRERADSLGALPAEFRALIDAPIYVTLGNDRRQGTRAAHPHVV